MKRLTKKISFLALIFTTWTSHAFATDPATSFSTGLQRYQEGKFEEAKDLFEQSLQSAPQSIPTLYNLGLTEYRLGKQGVAIALWRKALYAGGPDSTIQEALNYSLSKLAKKDLPKKPDLFETLRSSFLVEFNIYASLSLLAATIGLFGLSIITSLGQRKRALDADESVPAWGWKPPVLAMLLVVAVVITALKSIEMNEPRGTIIEKALEVRATPETNAPGLFEIYEGIEVVILERRSEWLRIRYPGGRSGWLPEASLMQTAGRKL